MKRTLALIGALTACLTVGAQNIQQHYDFGHNIYSEFNKDNTNRPPYTTTVEFFKLDGWGNTFFFVDFDYNDGIQGAYYELARELCFWCQSAVSWLSAHIEYDGGLNTASGTFGNAYLFGATYSGHSADYSKTWSLSLMYKNIVHQRDKNDNLQPHNYQITAVWNIDMLGNWLSFYGFLDFWREYRSWQNTTHILLTEPQFWLNLNKFSKLEKVNLSVGSEVKLSYNFVGEGFYCIPAAAVKWTF